MPYHYARPEVGLSPTFKAEQAIVKIGSMRKSYYNRFIETKFGIIMHFFRPMPNQKFSPLQKLSPNQGFTLMELMVVISIMAILATVLVINLAGQRSSRDIKIAENQLVSNIRQIQSSTLSAKTLDSGESVQFYGLAFSLAKPNQYAEEALYNVSGTPQVRQVQVFSLPPDVVIASATVSGYPITISRTFDGSTQNISPPSGCAMLFFAAPFGKTLLDNNCSHSAATSNIDTAPADGDDYGYIVNFVANMSCIGTNNPYGCGVSSDSLMTITLTDTSHTVSRTITVNGITGSVSFN